MANEVSLLAVYLLSSTFLLLQILGVLAFDGYRRDWKIEKVKGMYMKIDRLTQKEEWLSLPPFKYEALFSRNFKSSKLENFLSMILPLPQFPKFYLVFFLILPICWGVLVAQIFNNDLRLENSNNGAISKAGQTFFWLGIYFFSMYPIPKSFSLLESLMNLQGNSDLYKRLPISYGKRISDQFLGLSLAMIICGLIILVNDDNLGNSIKKDLVSVVCVLGSLFFVEACVKGVIFTADNFLLTAFPDVRMIIKISKVCLAIFTLIHIKMLYSLGGMIILVMWTIGFFLPGLLWMLNWKLDKVVVENGEHSKPQSWLLLDVVLTDLIQLTILNRGYKSYSMGQDHWIYLLSSPLQFPIKATILESSSENRLESVAILRRNKGGIVIVLSGSLFLWMTTGVSGFMISAFFVAVGMIFLQVGIMITGCRGNGFSRVFKAFRKELRVIISPSLGKNARFLNDQEDLDVVLMIVDSFHVDKGVCFMFAFVKESFERDFKRKLVIIFESDSGNDLMFVLNMILRLQHITGEAFDRLLDFSILFQGRSLDFWDLQRNFAKLFRVDVEQGEVDFHKLFRSVWFCESKVNLFSFDLERFLSAERAKGKPLQVALSVLATSENAFTARRKYDTISKEYAFFEFPSDYDEQIIPDFRPKNL